MHSPHKASFSKGQRVNFVLLRRAGNSEHLIGKAGDTTVIVCAGSKFKKPDLAIKGFFALEEEWWKEARIVAEIAKEAHQEDLDYIATAVPYDQQPMMTQHRISEGLSQTRGGKIVPFKPRQSELVAQPEEPLKKTQFMIAESLDLKVKAMGFDPVVLAKLGVTQRQARTAILTKGLESVIESLEGGGKAREIAIEPQAEGASTKSKRANGWKLKGLYLRPETVKRLLSYVRHLQKDDQKIDASDIVDQVLSAYLNKEAEPVVVKQVEADPVEAFYEERLASALATPEQLARGEENHELASLIAGMAGNLKISKRELVSMMLKDSIYTQKGFWKLGEES